MVHFYPTNTAIKLLGQFRNISRAIVTSASIQGSSTSADPPELPERCGFAPETQQVVFHPSGADFHSNTPFLSLLSGYSLRKCRFSPSISSCLLRHSTASCISFTSAFDLKLSSRLLVLSSSEILIFLLSLWHLLLLFVGTETLHSTVNDSNSPVERPS
ncbi:hypothetical protein C8J56DRAFT_1132322 [Mycena floridula]|nr:hypothetical protein C8J56DRAFT_1132322 [Mycena floridula]